MGRTLLGPVEKVRMNNRRPLSPHFARKKAGVKLGRPRGPGKSKLDPYRLEIETLLANGSTQKFIANRYGTTEANLSRWMKKHHLRRMTA
jgi:DNA-binding NarL/FixJ family response regulator